MTDGPSNRDSSDFINEIKYIRRKEGAVNKIIANSGVALKKSLGTTWLSVRTTMLEISNSDLNSRNSTFYKYDIILIV